jgi:hypothetical protein
MILYSQRLRRLHLPSIRVGTDLIPPSISVRDLGVFIDSDLSMRSHVNKLAETCSNIFRQLCCVRRSVLVGMLRLLVESLVFSRLD